MYVIKYCLVIIGPSCLFGHYLTPLDFLQYSIIHKSFVYVPGQLSSSFLKPYTAGFGLSGHARLFKTVVKLPSKHYQVKRKQM